MLPLKTDERQKSEYSKIGNFSFWVVYISLSISILVQLIMKAQFQVIVGELVCFLIGSASIIVGYIVKGLSCFKKPSILVSLACAFIGSLLDFFIVIIRTYVANGDLSNLFPQAIIRPVCVFVAVFILVWLIGTMAKKQELKLEKKFED